MHECIKYAKHDVPIGFYQKIKKLEKVSQVPEFQQIVSETDVDDLSNVFFMTAWSNDEVLYGWHMQKVESTNTCHS